MVTPLAARCHPREWPIWLGIAVGWCAARMPWAAQRRLGTLLGHLLGVIAPRRRRVIERNLALCFPERSPAECAALLRENLGETGIGLFEFLRAWWGRCPKADQFEIHGLHHVSAQQAQGRGVLLVSAHFLNLEIAGRLLGQHLPFAALYRPHDSAALEWAVARGRARYTVATFPRTELRPVIKHLKAGGVLWFAPDQESRRGDSVFVPFFGHPAWTLTSTHQLARLSGAAVLPFHHRRLADGRYLLKIGAALDAFPSADATADTARLMAITEAAVREVPSQYLWLHQRFKTQPTGAKAALYR